MVTFVGADAGGGNVSDIAAAADPVTWPAVQNGDVAVIFWSMQNTATPTIPAGWTVPTGGAVDSTSGALRMRVMYRVCDGSESGTISLTSSTALINRQSAVLIVYRGLDTSAPIDQLASRPETTSGTTHACPSVTTGVTNAVVITAVGERINAGTNAWTPPSGYTERADSDGLATGSGGSSVAEADDGLASGRASGTTVTPPVWTSGNGVATANVVTWTLSLAPQGATAISISDTGSGTEAVTAAASAPLTDTASSTAALTVSATASLTDTAAATDSLTVTAAAPLADSGSSAQQITATATATLTDTASAGETVTAGVPITVADAASAADALTAAGQAGPADTATAADAIAATATVPLTDTGQAAEALTVVVTAGLAESAAAVDALTGAEVPSGPVLADAATATETLAVTVAAALSDVAQGFDAVTGGTPPAVLPDLSAAETVRARITATETPGRVMAAEAVTGRVTATETTPGRITATEMVLNTVEA